ISLLQLSPTDRIGESDWNCCRGTVSILRNHVDGALGWNAELFSGVLNDPVIGLVWDPPRDVRRFHSRLLERRISRLHHGVNRLLEQRGPPTHRHEVLARVETLESQRLARSSSNNADG